MEALTRIQLQEEITRLGGTFKTKDNKESLMSNLATLKSSRNEALTQSNFAGEY